jgi:hypothetical protein
VTVGEGPGSLAGLLPIIQPGRERSQGDGGPCVAGGIGHAQRQGSPPYLLCSSRHPFQTACTFFSADRWPGSVGYPVRHDELLHFPGTLPELHGILRYFAVRSACTDPSPLHPDPLFLGLASHTRIRAFGTSRVAGQGFARGPTPAGASKESAPCPASAAPKSG